jgi:hypothetical protein
VFDLDRLRVDEFRLRPVDRVRGAAETPGESRSGGPAFTGLGVGIAGEDGVEADGAVRDGRVENPFGDERERPGVRSFQGSSPMVASPEGGA